MGVVLIAVALISGYVFASQHLSSRYRLSRTEGWHSYFYVASRGVIFGIIAAAFCFALDYYDCISRFIKPKGYFLSDFDDLFLSINDIKGLAWAFTTLLLAQVFGLASRAYYYIWPTRKDKRLQKIASENHLENFILEASFTQFPILITLKSRKTYVGLCMGDELINGEVDNIALIPYISGYRNKDELTFEDTTNYQEHYITEGILDGSHQKLTLNNFRIVVPRAEIESYAFFDLDTYIKFKTIERKSKLEKLQGYTAPVHLSGFTIRS